MARLLLLSLLLLLAAFLPGSPASPEKSGGYAAVDGYAYRAPEAAESSVKTLAAYLAAGAGTDEAKARALFTWIVCHISYDTADPKATKRDAAAPQSVLMRRKANCEGYSRLFEALASQAGLEVGVIRGYAKRWHTAPGSSRESLVYHAWNVVRAGGLWRPVDCTLGAGVVDEEGRFTRRFEDFYFFTAPESLAYSHFPDDPRWQLRRAPLSRGEFESRIHPRPTYFRYRMAALSHRTALIRTRGRLQVTVQAHPRASLTATLQPLAGKEALPECVFLQRLNDCWHLTALFPRPGAYVLRILVKTRFEATRFEDALTYRVEAAAGLRKPYGFPVAFASFAERDALLSTPLERHLPAGAAQRFRLTIPGATAAAVVVKGELFPLAQSGSDFEGTVTIPRSAEVVSVCAAFPGRDKLDMLLLYDVKN